MPSFKVSSADAKKFIKWSHTFAFSKAKKYNELRAKLRQDSSIGKTRKKSIVFLAQLHKEFKSMKNCTTDASCYKYLWRAALNHADETQLARLMESANVTLALFYPTGPRLNTYAVAVTELRKYIRAVFDQDVLSRHYLRLQFAGGQGQVGDANLSAAKKATILQAIRNYKRQRKPIQRVGSTQHEQNSRD